MATGDPGRSPVVLSARRPGGRKQVGGREASKRWAERAWASDRIEHLAWEGEPRTVPTAPFHPPVLTLLDGGDVEPCHGLVPLPPADGAWEERTPDRTLPRRPGDHLELFSFRTSETLRALRREARDRGLNPHTAISLVCERRLVLADLVGRELDAILSAIESAAVAAEQPLGMWAPNRAYLRHLHHGDPLEVASRAPLGAPNAAVPIRLLGRLGEHEVLAAPPKRGELAEAVNWEAAALCAGRLLGEWAAHTALKALRRNAG